MKPMKKGMKDNIERKMPSINDVHFREGIPMFSFLELNINEICNKANTAKTFLQRNIYQCPISIKANCYKSLVRPILEYTATTWSPHLQHQIYHSEKVQRSAAHFMISGGGRVGLEPQL